MPSRVIFIIFLGIMLGLGETREEVINIGGAEPQTLTVRISRHGPVISDTYGALKDNVNPDDPNAKPFREKAGIGLPEQPERLFEPYVTHKDKGTGLGLSIVRKIIEEHAGQLDLMDAPPFTEGAHIGAEVRILLPTAEGGVLTGLPKKAAE